MYDDLLFTTGARFGGNVLMITSRSFKQNTSIKLYIMLGNLINQLSTVAMVTNTVQFGLDNIIYIVIYDLITEWSYFLLTDDRENVYFILLSSSNRKYESLTIV